MNLRKQLWESHHSRLGFRVRERDFVGVSVMHGPQTGLPHSMGRYLVRAGVRVGDTERVLDRDRVRERLIERVIVPVRVSDLEEVRVRLSVRVGVGM